MAKKKKSDPSPNGRRRDFIAEFDKIQRHRHRVEVFSDFLEMAFCAVAKRTTTDKERQDALEARYMQTVGKYNRDEANAIARMFGVMQLALMDGGEFLGGIVSELELHNKGMAQYFSPWHLCQMMAKMIIGDLSQQIADRGFVTVCEPASGAGAMVLAVADEFDEQGFPPGHHMYCEAQDLSDTAYKMTYLQLACRGVPALVRHGNSLGTAKDVFDAAYTPAFFPFFQMHGGALQADREGKWKPPGAYDLRKRIAECIESPRLSIKVLGRLE